MRCKLVFEELKGPGHHIRASVGNNYVGRIYENDREDENDPIEFIATCIFGGMPKYRTTAQAKRGIEARVKTFFKRCNIFASSFASHESVQEGRTIRVPFMEEIPCVKVSRVGSQIVMQTQDDSSLWSIVIVAIPDNQRERVASALWAMGKSIDDITGFPSAVLSRVNYHFACYAAQNLKVAGATVIVSKVEEP